MCLDTEEVQYNKFYLKSENIKHYNTSPNELLNPTYRSFVDRKFYQYIFVASLSVSLHNFLDFYYLFCLCCISCLDDPLLIKFSGW